MILMIKLLSDMCTGSGEVYNTLADIDTQYDELGLPYIPAKRLKGCIKEAYLELVEMGVKGYSMDVYNKTFGIEGDQAAVFTIGNAYLADYGEMCKDLKNYKAKYGDKELVHPQNVLSLYTYLRAQTSIDYSTGTAKDGSLRNTRVVKKGLAFYSEVVWSEDIDISEKNELEKLFLQAACMVTHMGIRRTRGLGLVRITETGGHNKETGKNARSSAVTGRIAPQGTGRQKISYSIYLEAPVRCKTPDGNETRTSSFIEGSKIMGILAGAMGQSRFRDLLARQGTEHELICSNAYITFNGHRSTPLAASLQKLKDQPFDENGEMKVFNMLSDVQISDQVTSVGKEYAVMADEEDIFGGTVMEVDTSISYHHKRAEDKSVGRATGADGSAFYQLESINKGQTFAGYIIADADDAVNIIDVLSKNSRVRIGNGRNAEYGQAEITLSCCEAYEQKSIDSSRCHDFVVKLISPVIMYNNAGMYSADVNVLKDYLADELGVDYTGMSIDKCFLKYETVGGYNVTWGRKKPVFQTLGRGTVCLVHSDDEIDIARLSNKFIGERINEGYGELAVIPKVRMTEMVTLYKPANVSDNGDAGEIYKEKTDIIRKLQIKSCENNLRENARNTAKVMRDKFNKADDNAIIGRLILVNKEQETWKGMKEQVNSWSMESKRKRAYILIRDIDRLIKDAIDNLNGINYSADEVYQIISREYLLQIKYQYRAKRGGVSEDE